MLKMYNVPHLCVGKYGKNTYEKLVFGLERQLGLVEVAKGVDGMEIAVVQLRRPTRVI